MAEASKSRHFGAITSDSIDASVRTVRVDINCERPEKMTQPMVDEVDRRVDALDTMRDAALATFSAALEDANSPHDQVEKFWEFHHDEVDASITRDKFVAALILRRAGFYPQGKPETFAVLDFVVRGETTDQILVANFDRLGVLSFVSWES